MFETYSASDNDLEAVFNALEFVWKKETDFIFKDRRRILNVSVISYDSRYLYLWYRENNEYQLARIKHDIAIDDLHHQGWSARLRPSELEKFLPQQFQGNRFDKPKISGGLLTPFTLLQKKKEKPHNPYVSYESYLATIMHEFCHIYYDSYRLWWYSDKKENLIVIENARKLYRNNALEKKLKLWLPAPDYVSELFAFCGEYASSVEFWSEHKRGIDQHYKDRIDELINKEKNKNLNTQDSILNESHHDFAAIFGRLLLDQYPKDWPDLLLKKFFLS